MTAWCSVLYVGFAHLAVVQCVCEQGRAHVIFDVNLIIVLQESEAKWFILIRITDRDIVYQEKKLVVISEIREDDDSYNLHFRLYRE